MPRKHSVMIAGHATSFSLEDEFWHVLRRLAVADQRSIAGLVAEIDHARNGEISLSEALRLYILRQVMARLPVGCLPESAP